MNSDDLLREAFDEAVSDVAPTDRLAEIRRRTRRTSRRRWYAVGGASVLAAAAAVTAVAVLGHDPAPRATGPAGPVDTSPSPVATATDAAPTHDVSPAAATVFYVGPGSSGPDSLGANLYRAHGYDDDPLGLLMTTPADPDYRTLWPAGSLTGLSDPEAGQTFVMLADDSLHDRPAGMSEREAQLALQQVVYTVQAYAGEQVAVQFVLGDNPVDQVLGVPTSEPITADPPLEVLNHMSIDEPSEGLTLFTVTNATAADGTGSTLVARGRANSFEAGVSCQLVGADGAAGTGASTTAAGWQGPRLFAWRLALDVGGFAPGDYTLTCTTDDPTGGGAGYGAATDTRSITIE